MANQLADKPKTEEPKKQEPRVYSEAEVRAAVAEANARALADSNRMLQEAALARNMTPPPAGPRGPDAFEVFAKEGLTRSPEEQANLLRHGTTSAVRGELSQAVAAIRQEADWKLDQAKNEMALRATLSANPQIAADEEGFAAAMAKAGYRAQQRGATLDGPAMVQSALSIYREDHKSKDEPAPFVEGTSRPGTGPGGTERKSDAPNPIAQFLKDKYGVGGANDTVHGEERDFASEDAIDDYLEGRLTPDTSGSSPIWGITQPLKDGLDGTGVGSLIRQAQGDFNKRKARRAAAGG